MKTILKALLTFIACLLAPAWAATFTVSSTSDSGTGSLREAITFVNAACGSGPHTIAFNIFGAGPHTIAPTSALPSLTCGGTVIDGYTQSGSSPNSDTGATNNANIQIIINGASAGGDGLYLQAPHITIAGLALRSFGNNAMVIFSAGTGAVVRGNYIGTDPGGMTAFGNGVGISLSYVQNVQIGGASAADRNLITANGSGIGGNGPGGDYSGLVIRNNQIGGDRSGGTTFGNTGPGIDITAGSGTTGTVLIQNNYIVRNGGSGVRGSINSTIQFNTIHANLGNGVLVSADNNTVKGNDIHDNGTAPNGSGIHIDGSASNTTVESNSSYNNANSGVEIYAGPATLISNTIFGNTFAGIQQRATQPVSITGTRSHGNNGASGIVFNPPVNTTNDYSATPPSPTHDADVTNVAGGAPNFPEITSVLQSGGNTTVNGFLRTDGLGTSYRIELFSNSVAGIRQGEVFEDSFLATTDANGELTFSRSLTGLKTHITATATRQTAPVETSQYSPAVAAVATSLGVAVNFAPSSVLTGNVSTLSITFTNSGATVALVNAYNFTYPAGLINATVPNVASTCPGATPMAAAGGGSVGMSTAFNVPASGSCALSVSVKSLSAANYTMTVIAGALTSNVGANALTASATLTVTPPTLLPTATVSFMPASILVGGTSTLRISVNNLNAAPVGDWSLNVGYPTGMVNAPAPSATATGTLCGGNSTLVATPGGTSFDWFTTGVGLGPNETCVLEVTVTAAPAGSYVATIGIEGLSSSVGSNESTFGAALNVGLPPPTATLSPATLTFGGVQVGFSSAVQAVTLTNTSTTTALNLSSITASGPYSFAAGGTCAIGSPLAALSNCVLNVQFNPVSIGVFNNAVSVVTDAGTLSTTLTGTGTPAPAPNVQLLPASLDFGSVQPGATSSTQTLTLTNTGTAFLSVNSITTSAPFALALGPMSSPLLTPPAEEAKSAKAAALCPTGFFSLAPSGSCDMAVSFAPTASGSFSDNVLVATTIGTFSVGVTGQGGVGKAVTANPAAIDFGGVIFRRNAGLRSVTLSSTGFEAVTIADVQLVAGVGATAAELADFTLQHDCAVLQPAGTAGASCAVKVDFKPTALGARSADVRVRGNFEGGTLLIPLDGAGLPSPVPLVSFSASQFGFGQVSQGSSRLQSLFISNAGQLPIRLTAIYPLGDFFIQHNCPAELGVNGQCEVRITSLPSIPGLRQGSVVVESNADGAPFIFPLEATGCRVFSVREARQGLSGCGP
ncbi:MAG: choice-of-anchor D domain-containing protein [Betaproteobacteria bacterium]|nr:choice-of-anchor D domain-containing protein [Betaproteobacteria bacterium]